MITEERKKILLEELRGHSIAVENITESYKENLKLSERKEVELETQGGKLKVYIFTAQNRSQNCPVHINVHGGGFVRPHELRDEIWSSKLADALRGIVVDMDYSLAPEHPYPTAILQAYDTVKWVFSQLSEWDADVNRVSMGGYSAGANLTAAVCLKANITKEFRLCCQVLGYGCFDMVTPANEKRGIEENLIPSERMSMFEEAYSDGDRERLKEPFASPLMATDEMLQGLPAALVISAGKDIFRFEDGEYALKLFHNGVKVILREYTESSHGFLIHCTGEWQEAQQLVIDTLRTVRR